MSVWHGKAGSKLPQGFDSHRRVSHITAECAWRRRHAAVRRPQMELATCVRAMPPEHAGGNHFHPNHMDHRRGWIRDDHLLHLPWILLSFLTSMSVAAISTDQRVGFFATVSTYTSSAVAAGVSVLYVFSNVIAFAAFIVALTETLVNFLRNSGFTMIDGGINDMRIFSAVFCVLVLLAAAIRSADYFQCRLAMMLLVLIAVLMQMVGLTLPSLIMEHRINSTGG
ncbi:hypothetical protein OSTOST_25223 [Ostertagia ostertagi]